ncbi:hypothetical protein [uncultured Aquimarina sp.]|uniref:hypothetical protein n=1 Tax=uncultured Aquimarina sp. TaxID=575652 RepID=UPI00260EF92F|nr:hypothetical protein [uncultured Aquimarina sp.]
MRILLILFLVTITSQINAQNENIKVMPIEVNLTCEEALNIIQDEKTGLDDYNYALSILSKCKLEKYKESHPDEKIMSVGYFDKNKEKILFETLKYNTAEEIRDASKIIVNLYIENFGEVDPVTSGILYLGSDYTIDAFFESAVVDDPMIILAPLTIPGTKLGKDTLAELGRFGKKAEKAMNKTRKKVERHCDKYPEDCIVPGTGVLRKILKF